MLSCGQIKSLNKKLRQVEELEAKVASGDFVPSAEQRQKLARKPALLAELAEVRSYISCCRIGGSVSPVYNALKCTSKLKDKSRKSFLLVYMPLGAFCIMVSI